MQLKDRITAKLQKERKSVLTMSKETGISASRIYKWLDNKGNPKAEDARKLEVWLNGKMELVPNDTAGQAPALPRSDHAAYIKLLEDNDRFFKTEYHSLLVSLNKLMEIGMRSEELIKLNLEHIGNVEAMQKGVQPEVVHEQINNQIAGIGEDE